MCYQSGLKLPVVKFLTAKAKLDETQAGITKKKAQRQMMEHFIEELQSLPEPVETFDEGTWYALCDYITVYGKNDVRVTFKNGKEVSV